MIRLLLLGAVLCGGLVLVLSELPWFSRLPLTERFRPYVAPVAGRPAQRPHLTRTFREMAGPAVEAAGRWIAAAFGVNEALEARLERIHSTVTAQEIRLRQAAWASATFVVAVAGGVSLGIAPAVVLLFAFGLPLLAFLVIEQHVAADSSRWQKEVLEQLPVVTEQLGLLLGAGYSLGAALNRIARRGSGTCGADLRRVVARMRVGVSEIDALREWSVIVDVDAVRRLVRVLALNREAGDLSRLVSEEARVIRADAQRRLVEQIERRAQQVWIPVTVATLVPGVIFIAVPFVQALSLFSGS
jgi:Flp pilus assembly protein TadB